MNQAEKIASFRALHEACFVLPNPWDRGSARILECLGFAAVATSSAALAFSLGRPDRPNSLGLEATLHNIREIVDATSLPVNADFQAGFGRDTADLARSVSACVHTGVAGLSIEDATGRPDEPLFGLPEAADRVRAARAAIDASGLRVVLTARAECFLVGHPDPLRETVRRLVAYAEADCLYAPGLRTDEEIRAVVSAAGTIPVNVLAASPTTMSIRQLEALGVRRISVGSALARLAWRAFIEASRELASTGSFVSLARAEPFANMDAFFTVDTPED